ncbi:MAG: pilus assembly protein N-terminal domain-containing protein, partial [Phycisphaerae bacterium]|nr:pilus assembly protein N-terminal domain-containing protein [Phycisphaerae bacterium]
MTMRTEESVSAGRHPKSGRTRRYYAVAAVVMLALTSATAADPVKVLLGQSQLVDTPWPVRRVADTDPAVVNVQVLTPSQILLQGTQAGETDIILWGGDDEVKTTRVEVEIDVARIRQELQGLFPRTTVEASRFRDMVIIKGTLSRAEQIAQMRGLLDAQDVSYLDMTTLGGVQQVLLQVRVAEVSRTAIRTLGVNFFDGGENFFGGVSVGAASGGALNPVSVGPAEGTNFAGNIPFTFNADVGVNSSMTVFGGFPDKNFQFF